MDESLPLGSLDAATVRMLLEKERARTSELEQEIARLGAGLTRQNEHIIALERENAALRRLMGTQQTVVRGLTEQNALVRQEMAVLRRQDAQRRGTRLGAAPEPEPEIKPAAPPREKKTRTKRGREHNHGRRMTERANRWETHAAETCPQCGERLSGGWVQRRVQVIDLAPVAPLEITQHRIIRRQCPRCGKRVLPRPVGGDAGRIGRCRFGPRLIASIATMAAVERLPIEIMRERLRREYGLVISHGGIIGLLHRMADAGMPVYEHLQADTRASPVVHADETGWRQNGQHTTIWTVSTTRTVYLQAGRRTNEVIDGIVGADFAGTIVADCYAAYDHFLGPKQRCWAHLVRDLKALLYEHEEDIATVAWAEGILDVYEQARIPRPAIEEGSTPQALRARETRAQQGEALILLLCPAQLDPDLPYATLAARLRKHLTELFTFVRDPAVESTNNRAERSLRPVVIDRKITGGTRSERGSTTRMTLFSLAATARVQGKNPTTVYQRILLAPPGAPSPLAAPSPS